VLAASSRHPGNICGGVIGRCLKVEATRQVKLVKDEVGDQHVTATNDNDEENNTYGLAYGGWSCEYDLLNCCSGGLAHNESQNFTFKISSDCYPPSVELQAVRWQTVKTLASIYVLRCGHTLVRAMSA
jgi:hypothetical protein